MREKIRLNGATKRTSFCASMARSRAATVSAWRASGATYPSRRRVSPAPEEAGAPGSP